MLTQLRHLIPAAALLFAACLAGACSEEEPRRNDTDVDTDETEIPDLSYTIAPWDGETASDAALDIAGTEDNIFYEANAFYNKVYVKFADESATVTTDYSYVRYNVSGAYVTIDLKTNAVANTEIILSGKSSNGALKIYASKKVKLTLDGVELTSKIGPAINNQNKKKLFLHLADGTTNRLTDAATYSADPYYLTTSTDEDRKGCFFSEGNTVVSGHGSLIVSGRNRHGIAIDGYLQMRPGSTVVVTDAVKNGIHADGDSDEKVGITMRGGYLYVGLSSAAGKCLKSDWNIRLSGGKSCLNTAGDSYYDTDEKDTSSPAAVKTGGAVYITGGTHLMRSTGLGGKGINATGSIYVSGGETQVLTSGERYFSSTDLTSSPKGIKSDADLTVSGGLLTVATIGSSDGANAIECGRGFSLSGGEALVYAYDDALSATSTTTISGGRLFVRSFAKDAIDTDGNLTVSGGTLIAVGASDAKCGLAIAESARFTITGGTVIALGGSLESAPGAASTQCSVGIGGISLAKGARLALLDASGAPIVAFDAMRELSGDHLFVSAPALKSGQSGSFAKLGTPAGYSATWQGLYVGATSWSGGSKLAAFTASQGYTTVK
jgi:hypothetical protein